MRKTDQDEKENIVVVGTKDDLKKQEMFVRNINYVKYSKLENGVELIGYGQNPKKKETKVSAICDKKYH